MPTQKISATVDADVATQVRRRAGRRGLSAFVDRALRRELDQLALREFLDDLEHDLGPADEALIVEANEMLDAHERRITTAKRRRGGTKR
jgi:Arc/MetJ family transcription regulator